MSSRREPVRVVSLFAGAGGLDYGLKKAGLKVVWANDFDPDSCATYALNIGPHIHCGDVAEVDVERVPDADLVVGGFPCQGFSMANLGREPGDSRNKLYKHFVRIVKGKMPAMFVAENVRGILSLAKGEALKQIVRDFTRIGYDVDYALFNCADYGVPQLRQRVLIWGVRRDCGSKIRFTPPEPSHSKLADRLPRWVTVREAVEAVKKDSPNQEFSKYKVTNRNFTGHRWTDPNKPCPTILARGNGKGGVCAIQHPDNKRRMSVREQAAIQTFPDSYEFRGAMNSCYRQVGNAVPVEFARKLGLKIREAFGR